MSRRCPKCGKLSKVIDTREHTKDGRSYVRRSRVCKSCRMRWSTIEVMAGQEPTRSAKLRRERGHNTPLLSHFRKDEMKRFADLIHGLADRISSGDV